MALLAIAATVANLGANLFGAVSRRRAADRNYRFANQMAEDVLAQGEFAAQSSTMDLARLRGTKTANIAAQGIDVEQGTAAQIAKQTQRFGEQDIAQIRLNAAREAWGIWTQARLNRTAERNQAFAQGAAALGSFAADPVARQMGGTLMTRARNAWSNYIGRRSPMNPVLRDYSTRG